MPRFFFHVRDGKSIVDHKGAVLPDLQTARLNAIAVAGRILLDEPARIELGEDWQMQVTDEHGLILFLLNFQVVAAPVVLGAQLIKALAEKPP